MKYITRFMVLLSCTVVVGCSTNVSRFQMPGTDLNDVQTLFVKGPDDERRADEIQSLVTTELEGRGYTVAPHGSANVMGSGDYIFEVASDWHWDITWYLVELRVAIYNPVDNTLVAQAQSQQTSLVRKGVDVVVERAMASLFDESEESEESEGD